ncbi:MAG: OmpH family outer membrane protein [Bacteroidota bacterium]
MNTLSSAMKKLLFFAALLLSTATFGQRYAFVDTDFILENLPEYKEAQQELDGLSEKWQKTIEAKYAEIDRMVKAFQAEQILLTDDQRQQRQAEIQAKQQSAQEYQRSKFGVEGELFKKRQELVKPIQERVYNAIKEIAVSNSYAVIFDKANQSNILFANPRYDKSEQVLKKLGIKSGSQ